MKVLSDALPFRYTAFDIQTEVGIIMRAYRTRINTRAILLVTVLVLAHSVRAQSASDTKAAIAAADLRGRTAPWVEATIPELQRMMAQGRLSSVELTQGYLDRIERLNPLLHAVIQTNRDALNTALLLDLERRFGHVRGPLHGIPVLLKDNIATNDRTETTAGSLALVGSRPPEDAVLVEQLRRAGAVILGKANLSEWANFRGFGSYDGWSARGGFTRNPYVLDWNPCGSSSGSAVAAAANLAAVTVGTETDGSIVCPAGNNAIVGLKPTIGLIAQQGVIPISHVQDSAGPMGRTVRDVAILLNAMKSPFGPVAGHHLPHDYTVFLREGSLRGARIGIDRRLFQPDYSDPDVSAVVDQAVAAMKQAGAEIIDPVDSGDPATWGDAELVALEYEFKADLEAYLGTLLHTEMRTLGDLIGFNREHCEQEMKFFGQQIFELSEATGGDLTNPVYLDARAQATRLAREEGIDRALSTYHLDAILAPSFSWGSSAPAVAGYPIISVPVGYTADGRPAGAWLYSGFLQEPKLLALAYGIEQLLHARQQPQYLSSVPPDPPDAGICAPTPAYSPATPGSTRAPGSATLRRFLPGL